MKIPLSIVITTYNREIELRRCINSIIEQNYDGYEIIVVDDHSPISYQKAIEEDFPNVRYFYQVENKGPGIARNRGIQEAKYNYVVIMDDDDIFVDSALEDINNFLVKIKTRDFPVYNFLRSNAKNRSNEYYSVLNFKEILEGAIQGDLTPVINKQLFLGEANYAYPESRIGAESLLWYRVALDYGFPIINSVIVILMDDSTQRLTHIEGQIKKAKLFAEYQRELIHSFEKDMIEVGNISYLLTKYKGAITYSLLEGDRNMAIKYLVESLKYSKKQIVFFPLLCLPKAIVIKLFLKYRT